MLLTDLEDGLYQVTYKGICAGFVVKNHVLVKFAPILYSRYTFWMSIAVRIGDDPSERY